MPTPTMAADLDHATDWALTSDGIDIITEDMQEEGSYDALVTELGASTGRIVIAA